MSNKIYQVLRLQTMSTASMLLSIKLFTYSLLFLVLINNVQTDAIH
jgi:hypothetical protein